MNDVQIQNVLDTFNQVGFKNLKRSQLERIHNHFEKCNKRMIMVLSHTSNHDFLLGLLLFGASSIPITMFTNFRNPFLGKLARHIGMLTAVKNKSNTQCII